LHIYQHAEARPDRIAFVIADTGEQLTYRQLDDASNRGAQLFRELGLKPGDTIGILLRNGPALPVAYWAGQRAGLVMAMLSTHLKPAEAAYILNDCGAKALITSAEVGDTAVAIAAQREALTPGLAAVFGAGDAELPGARSWEQALAAMPATPIPDQISGRYLFYSSGTTGRPKGIVLPYASGPIEDENEVELSSRRRMGHLDHPAYLNAGPLYHAAPLAAMIGTHRVGGTFVTLRKFDALTTLKAIERWRVGFAQFVPTMFVRMLQLPEADRLGCDLSSLTYVVHAAAPCPVEVKRRVIDWLGTLVDEYYSGSEGFGQCYITGEEWLRKPGSVGRATWGVLHICDEEGKELPAGQDGLIYFESERSFEYLNDEAKTAKSRHPTQPTWKTLGDIGHVDEDGYLFLTDRKDFMIVSGGVNIYPQAVEDLLTLHPKVADVAVIGVPNPDFGEEVKAVVQPADGLEPSEALARELIDYCRERVANISCPRTVDFVAELPRLASGKLAKKEIRARYWT
jgi:long-chain acyl-CoA synthetase